MWNPVNQIKEAWNSTTTTWGKLAVLMFYVYLWLGILSGLVSVLFPSSQGIDCYNAHFDAPTQQIVMSQMRVENLLYVVVYLFLGVHQTNICTVTILAIVMMLCYCFSRPAMIELDVDCWNGVKTSIILLSFAPVIIWILVVVEFALTRRRGTGSESQPLI